MLKHRRQKEGPRQAARRAEEALEARTEQLQAISEAMTTYLDSGNWNEASAMLLRSALGQTESEYGFVGVVVEGPALRVLAHEGIVWDAVLNREFYENALRTYQELGYLEFTDFDNLFGKVITEGKTLLTNEPAADPRSGGLPPGHPPMGHFLGVPIFRGSDVVGIIGVANRPGGYSGEEQGKIEILTQAAGVLYENYRQRQREAALEAERKQAEEELRRLNFELIEEQRKIDALNRSLEEKVQHRTEELQHREELTRSIIDTAKDAFISMDPNGLITDWNAQAEATFGWSRGEALGQTLKDTIIPPQLREAHENGLKHFLATGAGPVLNKRIEITALHRDGHQFPVEMTIWVVRSGETCTFNAFVRNISERKQAEEALRESEERYRDLYDGAPVAYFAIGKDGRIAKANRRAAELLGYSLDDLTRRPVLDLYSDTPAGKDKAKRVIERFRRGRETHDEEMEMRRADGSPVWVSLTVRIVRDAGGQPVESRSMVLDITERKRAEEALRMAQEELESGAELQAQGVDSYGFSLRELTVLNLVASGKTDKEIGTTLGISARTVQKHVEKLCKRMGASTRTEASVRALREGLID